jgi:inner membrane protein
MSPETHLLLSWAVAAKTTDNPRDLRLVTLAGILPDADGLGLIPDLLDSALGRPVHCYYALYHHWLLHGLFGAALVTVALTCFARRPLRVAFLALVLFHLHLLCDLLGSRGPSPSDLWPIYYLGPFSRHGVIEWAGQWRLDGWQNRWFSVALFVWALWFGSTRGHSPLGVFHRRADANFCAILQKWRLQLTRHFKA